MFERIVEELKGFSVEGLSRPQLCDVTGAISRVRGALDALEVAVAVAVDGLGDDGVDSGSVMRNQGGCSRREAARRKRRADKLRDMPNTRKRLADGELTSEHADELVKAAEATSVTAVDSDDELLDDATRRPADLAGRDVRDWVDRHLRDEDRADRHARQRARRSLSIFNGDDDMSVLHCRTDKVTGEQLRARIEAVANQLYRHDGGRQGRDGIEPRTRDQLRHDAFMIVMGIGTSTARSASLGDPEGGDDDPIFEVERLSSPSSSVRNQIVVVADLAALLGDESGSVEIAGVGPIPRAVLERLGCDSDLFGHVFGVDAVSLWHGRAIRTTTPQQWRTLVARDRGCVICGAAPAYCEAHHVVPWKLGGRTDVENLALMCGRHHHELHDTGQVLIRTRTGWKTGPARAGPAQRKCAA